MKRRLLWLFLILVLATGAVAYGRLIGFPREFAGHAVYPKVTWYEVGPPPLFVYPGEVYYGYVNAHGDFVRHGPYERRVWQSTAQRPFGTLRTAEAGSYVNGERDGVFVEYQTFWNAPAMRTTYVRGRQVRIEFPRDH